MTQSTFRNMDEYRYRRPANIAVVACTGCMWYITQVWDYNLIFLIFLVIICLIQLPETTADINVAPRHIIAMLKGYAVSLCLDLGTKIIFKHYVQGMPFPLPHPLLAIDVFKMFTFVVYLGVMGFIAKIPSSMKQR